MNDDLVRFAGKVAVITGGAKGIGRACALRFAREGARVAVLDILADEASTTAQEAAASRPKGREASTPGQEALAIQCDVGNEAQLAAAIERIIDAWGRIDIWVNNAGAYTGSPLLEVPRADWEDTLGTNFTGVFLGCRAVAPIMRQQRSGRIINVSSMAGKISWPATAEYSASKSAVIGLTRSVALDMAPFGVTVNAVCPGNTLTGMLHQVAAKVGPRQGMTAEDWLRQRANDCPLGRLATPDEIAGPVAFLASDEARYYTGQSISIDGGMVL
jgi:NAD(P)-dependent dehydrogenase (short-subunit alcohol dehydrogenase family)